MRICLTILNHDFRCRRIVSHILQRCSYEELHTGRLPDTLKAIWEKKDTIDYVVTNLHKLGAKGASMLDQLKRKNLRIGRITPGDEIPEWKGEEINLSAYVLDVPSMEDMNNLLAFAVAKEEAVHQEGSSAHVASETPASEPLPVLDEQSEASGDDNPVERKTRVVWTKEMHRKFLEAIEILGPDNSFPKKIVELMNEPGLTRENVASHLQKYRMCLRRNQEEAASSNSGVKLSLPSSDSALSVNSSRRYSRVNRRPYSSPFQRGSGDIISVPYLGPSHSFAGTGSFTSISSLRPANLLVGSIQEGIQQQQDGLMQMQPYISRCPMVSGFRIYGDKTRSMLFSTEDGSSSSSATSPSNSQNLNTFIGLRVTGDGNLEFGQTSLSGSNEIETSTISLVGTSGTEILDHSNPLSSVSYAPKPPNTLPQEGSHQIEVPDHSNPLKSARKAQNQPNALPQECSYQNKVSDHFPSIFSDWTSEEYQEILALLTAPLEKDVTLEGNVTDCPALLVEGTEQDQFLPSGASFPLVGTLEESSTSLQHEPDSFQPEEDINASLKERGSSSPDRFWEGVYEDADISRFH